MGIFLDILRSNGKTKNCLLDFSISFSLVANLETLRYGNCP